MRKEDLNTAKDLIEKIDEIDKIIKDIKKANRWGFASRTVKRLSIFTETKSTTGYASISYYDRNAYNGSSNDMSIYHVHNDTLKNDILEVLEKHKALMEEALAEL